MSLFPLSNTSISKKILFTISFICLLCLLFPGLLVSAAELTVHEGESIQNVFEFAQNGDVVIISAGIYEENLVIDKSLTVIGEDGAVIDGSGKGNVITIKDVDEVTISGLTIQHSGKIEHASGIYIEKGMNHRIENNRLMDNHFGMYIDKGNNHQIVENEIIGRDLHFSDRGNGIHLYRGGNHILDGNKISHVQDGVYFDFTEKDSAMNNLITESRYGLHYMYSEDLFAEKNKMQKNIMGILVMDSARLELFNNYIYDHFHVRGCGAMFYRSKDIVFERNELIRNSTAMSFEQIDHSHAAKNIVATNQVGLEFIGENQENIFTENNFITNIVQSKIANKGMRLDDGKIGNYWDNYGQLDLTGDGIGEERYKAGSLYDQLIEKQPAWQFFFESPAIKMWSKAESMFPTINKTDVYDELPAIEPFPLQKKEHVKNERNSYVAITSLLLIMTSASILIKGRRF